MSLMTELPTIQLPPNVNPSMQATIQVAVNKVLGVIEAGRDAVAHKFTGTASSNGVVVTLTIECTNS